MYERLFDDIPTQDISGKDRKALMEEMKESEAELYLEAVAQWLEHQYAWQENESGLTAALFSFARLGDGKCRIEPQKKSPSAILGHRHRTEEFYAAAKTTSSRIFTAWSTSATPKIMRGAIAPASTPP